MAMRKLSYEETDFLFQAAIDSVFEAAQAEGVELNLGAVLDVLGVYYDSILYSAGVTEDGTD